MLESIKIIIQLKNCKYNKKLVFNYNQVVVQSIMGLYTTSVIDTFKEYDMKLPTLKITGLDKALAKAGSQENMAKQLGVTQQAISLWAHQGWVPTRRAIEIEQTYGVSRAELISPRLIDLFDEKEL